MRRISALSLSLLCLAAGLSPASLLAQPAGSTDAGCTIAPAPNGVIRGDRVPSGCVITVQRPRPEEPEKEASLVVGGAVVLVPVLVFPRFFFPDPPFVGVPPGPGAVEGAEGLPRVRSEPFGPIFRPFGPVVQPFRPTNRDFGRAPDDSPPSPRPRRVQSP